MSERATDDEIAQFKQGSASATSDVWHVSLPFVRKLIARLEAEHSAHCDVLQIAFGLLARADAAEAKLAKAREALRQAYDDVPGWVDLARAALDDTGGEG